MIMYTWKILLLSFDFPRCHRRLFQFQHGVLLLVGCVLRGPTRVLFYNITKGIANFPQRTFP